MSFQKRKIDVTFRLGEGAFGASGFNTVKVTGRRVMANITRAGGLSLTSLDLRVFGLPLSVMNQLTVLQKSLEAIKNNVVIVEAGYEGSAMNVVFIGTIYQAWADMGNLPEAAFMVSAHDGMLAALRPLPPTSFNGSADVALLIGGIAKQMGYAFENSGVSVQLSNQYASGTAISQLKTLAENAHINCTIENENTVVIWPKDGSREGVSVAISKETGLIGYPTWTENGLILKTEYNPDLFCGRTINVKSIITPANGQWTLFGVDHTLESELPNGQWSTTVKATIFEHIALEK